MIWQQILGCAAYRRRELLVTMNIRRERMMSIAIQGVVTNGVVVPSSPLPEGARVEVTILPVEAISQRLSMLEFLATLPPGPRAFKTWEEYERHLRQEKDAWDR
jgi:hypothetical protein